MGSVNFLADHTGGCAQGIAFHHARAGGSAHSTAVGDIEAVSRGCVPAEGVAPVTLVSVGFEACPPPRRKRQIVDGGGQQ